MKPFWEDSYKIEGISSMGTPSFEVAEIAHMLPQGAKVLDLGCGEGRNAFFLAAKGFQVTAVDHSQAGIGKLLSYAERFRYPISAYVAKIEEFPIEDHYDLVMAHGVLYYLENDVWRKLLTKVKEATRPGGFNIFTIFVYNDQYPCSEEILAAGFKGSFVEGELGAFYNDWTTLRYDKYVKWDAHPGVSHVHPIEKLVVQKQKEENLLNIELGIDHRDLLAKAGVPTNKKIFPMSGPQIGNDTGYQLELWCYGRQVFYIVNGKIEGRALYQSVPRFLL